jgi:hypothetical protein
LNPTVAQFQALDEIFAGYPRLTLVHIIPALFFLLLAPLQFSRTFRDRHLQWHRRTGRIQRMDDSRLLHRFSHRNDPADRWNLFATVRFTGLTPYEFFGTAFWIGFVLHLISAEVWIQWTRPQAFKISSLYLRKETYHGDA